MCVIDRAGGVITFQNSVCKLVCGVQEGQACSRKGFRFCENPRAHGEPEEGMSLSRCEGQESGEHFDVTLIRTGETEMILLYPLKKRLEQDELLFAESPLTARELTIVKLVLRRRSNHEICQELSVSENTLRTHLKSIYRKASPEGQQLLRRVRGE